MSNLRVTRVCLVGPLGSGFSARVQVLITSLELTMSTLDNARRVERARLDTFIADCCFLFLVFMMLLLLLSSVMHDKDTAISETTKTELKGLNLFHTVSILTNKNVEEISEK